jgi:hypothetical protein
MAKARPKAPVVERAIKAFRKAHPSCPSGVTAHKVRSRQVIRVRGYESDSSGYGLVAEWSYADNGSLKRIS